MLFKGDKMKSLLLVLMGLGQLAFAGNTDELPDFSKQVDRVNVDIDKDGIEDAAYLIHGANGELDLWVDVSTEAGFYKTSSVTIDMNGGSYGMGSELILNPQGSIVVHSYNDAIGRSRWDRKVTFAHRRGGLVLAGYTWAERDTLDLSNMHCDINLLSRQGFVQGQVNTSIDNFEEPELDDYEVSFEVNRSDVLSVADANETNIFNIYVDKYCYGSISDIDNGYF